MRKTFKRVLISVLCVLMLISAMPIASITADAAGQTSIALKQESEFAYTDGWNRTVVKMTADGKMVYCLQPDLPAPPNGTYRTDNGKLKEITSSDSKYTMYRKALYYCYGGDGFNTSNAAFKTNTNKHKAVYSGNTPSAFIGNLKWNKTGTVYYTSLSGSNLHYTFTHLVLSYINYGDSKYKSTMGIYIPYSGYYDQVKELYDALKAAPNPPITTKLYLLNIGSQYQQVIVVRNGVKLQLQKSSANSSVEYSLAGAKYNIYLDKNCKDYFGYITTDENGYGRYGNGPVVNGKNQGADVPLQTYYCKEVEAPKGYELDNTVYEFKKTSSSSEGSEIYRATVKDTPVVKLQLIKSSANCDITDDNSCYSLAGAKYNIYTDSNCTNYYGYITTDENGYGRYGNGTDTNTDVKDKDTAAYKKNSGKSITLKSGVTYYAKEAEAPKGYELDDETLYQFKDSGSVSSDGIKIFRAYDTENNEQPKDNPVNDPVGIVLQKRNAVTGETTNQGLENAVFEVQYYAQKIDKDYDVDTSKGETAPTLDSANLKRTWYIKTNSNGRTRLGSEYLVNNDIYTSGDLYFDSGIVTVPIGTVVINEVKEPDGYTKSPVVFYRQITEDGAKFAQDTNTPIEVPIDEPPANGYAGIHKMNKSGQGVANAEYGLYSDKNATVLVSSLTTDSNGDGVFDFKCNINQTYYIKEIKAPTGYQLDTTVYPITPTEDNRTVDTAVIQDIYEDSVKGSIVIKKSANDNQVANLWYAVEDNLGNQYNAVTTDSTGTATITGLPVYDSSNKKISYTVRELGFKTTPGTKSYGGYTWTVNAKNCIKYKGSYYEGLTKPVFSGAEYAYSRYYYGDKDLAIANEKGYTKTLLDNSTVTFEFENTVPTTNVEVFKNSFDGRKSGFWFSVLDQFGINHGDIVTNNNGYAKSKELYSFIQIPNTSVCLPLKYQVKELGFRNPGASGDYYFPDTYKEKYVSELTSANITNSSTIKFEAYNEPDTGQIDILKSSDDGDVKNVCFEISAYEDSTEYGGDLEATTIGYNSSGNEITSFILKTGADGTTSTKDLELYDCNGIKTGLPVYIMGTTDAFITYEIKELGFENGDGTYTFPDRYIKNEPVRFNLLDNRNYVYKCFNATVEPGKLQISKTSEDNEVENIWFNVKSSIGYDCDFVTDESGLTPVIDNLPIYVPATQGKTEFVKYTITELGYQNDDGTYSLPYKYNKPKAVTVTLDTTGEIKVVSVTNTLKKGAVTLYKQDYDGNALAGSQWTLYNAKDDSLVNLVQTGNGAYMPSSTGKATTLTTDTQGKLYVSNLEQGEYYFVETKSPTGTAAYGRKVSFKITGENANALAPVLTVKNDKIVMFETGGNGLGLFYFAGYSIMAISIAFALYYAIAQRRRKHGKCKNSVPFNFRRITMKKRMLSMLLATVICLTAVMTAGLTVEASSDKYLTISVPNTVKLGYGEDYKIPISTNLAFYKLKLNNNYVFGRDAKYCKWQKLPADGKNTYFRVCPGATGTGTMLVASTSRSYYRIEKEAATCKVTVYKAPSKVSLSTTSKTVGKGEHFVISECTNSGSYANAKNLKWSSSNSKVAKVTKLSGNKALVNAVGCGTADITIKTYNGKTAKCRVTVKSAPTKVVIGCQQGKHVYKTLSIGKWSYNLSAYTPSGTYCSNEGYTWTSSNNKILKVVKDSKNKAKITGLKAGTVNLTVKTYNGKTATCKVTVK